MARSERFQFAEVLKVPVDRLLVAARPGGHQVSGPDARISERRPNSSCSHTWPAATAATQIRRRAAQITLAQDQSELSCQRAGAAPPSMSSTPQTPLHQSDVLQSRRAPSRTRSITRQEAEAWRARRMSAPKPTAASASARAESRRRSRGDARRRAQEDAHRVPNSAAGRRGAPHPPSARSRAAHRRA